MTTTNVSWSELLTAFGKHFLVGGAIIAIVGVILEHFSSPVAGLVYGAFPLGFIYLFWVTYHTKGLCECSMLSKHTLLATVLFVTYVGIVWAMCKTECHPLWSFLLATAVFIVMGIFYYHYALEE
jgi:hypothetical protein